MRNFYTPSTRFISYEGNKSSDKSHFFNFANKDEKNHARETRQVHFLLTFVLLGDKREVFQYEIIEEDESKIISTLAGRFFE